MSQPEGQGSSEEILRYLDTHGVVDKDSASGSRRTFRSKPRRRYDTELDLHGLTAERAEHLIETTLTRCRRNGAKRVLVVHGRGLHSDSGEGPVLRELVQQLLQNRCAPLIRNYRTAPPRDGGQGATIVYL